MGHVLADWLDPDTQPTPDGAEDNVYTSQTPPYRAANGPITSVSELLALPDFGVERYQKLKPYVTALPIGTKINLCTAPGIVIDALSNGTREFGLDEQSLARGAPIIVFRRPTICATHFMGRTSTPSQTTSMTKRRTFASRRWSLLAPRR